MLTEDSLTSTDINDDFLFAGPTLRIDIHIGTADILFCDNDILHLYLESLNIQHEYRKFEGIDHTLEKIL